MKDRLTSNLHDAEFSAKLEEFGFSYPEASAIPAPEPIEAEE